MNKNLKIALILIVQVCLSSCGSGVGDTFEELSGGYTFRTDGNMHYIISDNIFKDGVYPNVVDLVFNKNLILVEQKPSKQLFKVFLASSLQSRYDILSNLDSINRKELSPELYSFYKIHYLANKGLYEMLSHRISKKNTVEDIAITEIIADSLIRNDKFYKSVFLRNENYWIIDHRPHIKKGSLSISKIYGPFSKGQYLEKRGELIVPLNLKLKMEE